MVKEKEIMKVPEADHRAFLSAEFVEEPAESVGLRGEEGELGGAIGVGDRLLDERQEFG